MGMANSRVQVAGSARMPVAGARAVGGINKEERVAVTVRVRPAGDGSASAAAADPSSKAMPERRYLSRAQLRSRHGADPRDIAVVTAFAKEHGLVVIEAVAAERKVVLEGTAAEVSAAFAVTLQRYVLGDRTYRGRTGTVSVPAALGGVVEGVLASTIVRRRTRISGSSARSPPMGPATAGSWRRPSNRTPPPASPRPSWRRPTSSRAASTGLVNASPSSSWAAASGART